MEQNKKKQKKKGGAWWILILLAISAVRGLDDPAEMGYVVAGLVCLAVLALVISVAVKKAKANGGAAPVRSTPMRGAGSTASYRPAAVPVYTTDGEGNSDRDRQRRREQLDGFLKNGIVDKREYDLLRARHEGR